ncbi:hypothetical protein [Bradyrhizobium sp. RDM4]|uniref:hypothetical protein n=1 Tax=Bradyrhizobium sp. RDM4 TaxID=3378765 RepID=UPI0038FC5E99
MAEIDRLIAFLDQSDPYATELEDACEDEGAAVDEEPSLGSFDRMTDQSRS